MFLKNPGRGPGPIDLKRLSFWRMGKLDVMDESDSEKVNEEGTNRPRKLSEGGFGDCAH